jgi:hypothetical protein
MKQLLSLLILTIFINAEEMSSMEHQTLHTYNKRPTLKNSSEKNAHKLHKIDEKKAKEIAGKICKEHEITLKLIHSQLYLYYEARTKNCLLYINALDGKLIDPETINKRNQE